MQHHENREFGGVWIGKGEVENMVGDTGIEPVASSV
jgi:hypothetical protein